MKFTIFIKKYPRTYLMSHVAIWFSIGMIIGYFISCIPVFENADYLYIAANFAGWFAMIFGFLGGIYILLNDSDKYQIE